MGWEAVDYPFPSWLGISDFPAEVAQGDNLGRRERSLCCGFLVKEETDSAPVLVGLK